MTRARAALISVEETPYYHCTGRCVRRAFLCGFDTASGRSYEHRKSWLQERLALLTEVFAIELCAYAIMSNHYHLVIRLNPGDVPSWSDVDVIERWTRLFVGPLIARRTLNGETLTQAEQSRLSDYVIEWRKRLADLSWFMRCLNETIARRANREDECTGHFWEGRFKCQALLDEPALITAMAYADLNPIRAGLAVSIPGSDYTGAQVGWRELTAPRVGNGSPRPHLMPFAETGRDETSDHLPFRLHDYLELLDHTGRIVRDDKRGFIPGHQPRLLDTLGVAPHEWLATVRHLQGRFELAIGAPECLRRLARRWGKRWLHGISAARRLYPSPSG